MKVTKKTRLLAMLRRQWTSPLECLEAIGLMTLSQRVSEFRRMGIKIRDKWVTSPSGARYKAYRVG